MANKNPYILMYRDEEVLSFEVVSGENRVIEMKERLSGYDKAPIKLGKKAPGEDSIVDLHGFLMKRSISANRSDYQEILSHTGFSSGLELSLQGHGLSLSDHYWYKREGENLRYSDINFFQNKWDDSFARAVLSGNYEELSHVDLNVPDIVTQGWSIKGWLYGEKGSKLYKLGIQKDHCEECLAEVLTSKLANRLFGEGKAVGYELERVYGRYASASKVMIGIGEDMLSLSTFLPSELHAILRKQDEDVKYVKEFLSKISGYNFPGLYDFFVKALCLRSLSFLNDFHFDNISFIRNKETGERRIAPLYDLANSFGSSENAQAMLSSINKATYLFIFYYYGRLDADWDYSWYDPHSLDGFEEQIRETLSKSDFYTQELLDNIIEVYRYQKSTLDSLREKKS
ncbi:MAG: hypothetical protein K6B65_02530 [Bacilli bacterium]|nr:hypothetical protein [Bacilli bacterium]